MSGIEYKCPFCNTGSKGNEEQIQEIRKRVAANDPASIFVLANYHELGSGVLQQAHSYLGDFYYEGGDLKKSKLHLEAAAMA